MEESQILELCNEVLNDQEKEFKKSSIKQLTKEDKSDGLDIIIQSLEIDRKIEFEYLGFLRSFDLNEKQINVTGKIENIAGREITSQKRISGA